MAEPSFTVSILSRPDSTSTFPTNIKVIKTDYTHDSLVEALKGQDALISSIAGTALTKQIDIIDAAIEAGVKRFVPGEFGSDTTNDKALARVTFFGVKRAVTDHLKSKEGQIAWTGIITGPFFDWGMKMGLFGFDFAKQAATLYEPGHAQPFSSSTLADIGTATARSLLPKNNALAKNKYIYVRSLTTTQDELLAAFEKQTGKTWGKTIVELEPLVKDAGEKVGKGDMSGIVGLILGALWDPECGMDFDVRGVVMNEELGMGTMSAEEAVKALL